MINFKDFLCEDIEPVYLLNDFEKQQVENILSKYLQHFNPSVLKGIAPEKFYKKQLLGLEYAPINNTLNLGKLKYVGGDVMVVVNFDKNILAKATYEKEQNVIELFYYHFNKLLDRQKRTTIVHELFHAKQEDKNISSDYKKAVRRRTYDDGRITIRSKRGYFFSKNEYIIYVSTIIFEIDREYNFIIKKIKSTESAEKKTWEKVKERFFSSLLRFIESGDIKNLPAYLHDEQDFIKTIFRNKKSPEMVKYYDFLRDRLYDFYKQLLELGK